jgi:hypothetical protein
MRSARKAMIPAATSLVWARQGHSATSLMVGTPFTSGLVALSSNVVRFD